MLGGRLRRGHVLAAAGVALALAAGLVVAVSLWGRSGDGAPPDYPGARPWTPQRQAMLDSVAPRPSCPRAAPVKRPGEGRVIVDHFRVENGCLVLRGEVVAAGEAFDRIRVLRDRPRVVSADLRPVVRPASPPPRDPGKEPGAPLRDIAELDSEDLWAYQELDGDAMRDAIDTGQPRVKVAVIDTAIDGEHPELDGVVETLGDGPDLDGSGGSHGTRVASLIAARDDDVGLTGLMPHAEIVSAPWQRRQGQTWLRSLAERIEASVNHQVNVINISGSANCEWGSAEWSCADENSEVAIRHAHAQGIVVVTSAGNKADDGSPVEYPATVKGVISVAAHDRDGERNASSSANRSVDLSAPGVDVLVAGHRGRGGKSCRRGYTDGAHRWCLGTGTSLSAPLATATVAWLMNQHPGASPSEIRNALLKGARAVPGQKGRSDEYGHGYLDPLGADQILRRSDGVGRPGGLVAYRAGHSALGVADVRTGRTATLMDSTGGNMGAAGHPLRFSPDGRHIAGRTAAGGLYTWDVSTLDFSSGDRAAPFTQPGAACGCAVDFVFVDDTTIAVLQQPGAREANGPRGPGRQLAFYDVRTGKSVRDTSQTPPLTGLAGPGPAPGSLLALRAGGPSDITGSSGDHRLTNLVQLDKNQRVTRTIALNSDGVLDEWALSPNRRSLAFTTRWGASASVLEVVNLASGKIRRAAHPVTEDPPAVRRIWNPRWTGDGRLVVWAAALRPKEMSGALAVYRKGALRVLDQDPVRAAKAVGPWTQIVLVGDPGSLDGDLYLLHRRSSGEAGDVYSHPGKRDRPVARGVQSVWFSPGGPSEPPFPLR